MKASRSVVGLGALAATVAALSVAAVAAAQEAPVFPELDAAVPVGDGVARPCLSSVAGEALCGRFRVWEDRDAREGRTLDLAFVVLGALEDRGNTDAYTQFNGGPGASTTSFAAGYAQFLAAVRRDRDILLVDARGTGNSGPLRCDVPYPGGIASRFETVFPPDHVARCRDRLQQRADLSQYTTPRAMDDLADIARWLGYTGLNLSGGSYGTREAQVFTRRHPDLVRTVIMNGVAPVHEPVYVHHARYLQEALDNLFDECEADARCSAAYPDLRSVSASVMAGVRQRPPTVQAEGQAVSFAPGALSYALRGLLYGQSGTVPARLYEAHEGDWQPLADYYVARQSWVGASDDTPAGYHYSVLCAEDVDPLTWDEIAQATEGTFMGDHLIGGYKRACDLWPSAEPPASYFEAVGSDKPALILSGGRDPVTPVSGAEAVAALWPNSLHVVVPNGGHGQGGPCVMGMLLHLVRTGSVEGIDTSCVAASPPTTFEIR
jgi:pimeloyl-ACP methyl ester carboxylesterase